MHVTELSISRTAADGLAIRTWTFRLEVARVGPPMRLRFELVRYAEGAKNSPKARTVHTHTAVGYGTPSWEGGQGAPEAGWYVARPWRSYSLDRSQPVPAPALPGDVQAELLGALHTTVGVAGVA